MDLRDIIRLLKIEKERFERAIAALEELQAGGGRPLPDAKPNLRGRKSMAEEERSEVSARMRRYWAKRRQSKPEVES